jgi:hypothetical protein
MKNHFYIEFLAIYMPLFRIKNMKQSIPTPL